MKRSAKIILVTLITALALSVNAFAASGLSAFVDVQKMDSTTFQDVDSLSWYFGGVCRAYDKGIMEGTSPTTFAPKGTVTWSQAITIAARIHATYYGMVLDKGYSEAQQWYTPYVIYATGCGMLPSNCPKGAAVDTTAIDRSSIAYLLSKAIDPSEMPTISDLAIPDLDKVGDEFKPAVQLMYSSGVIQGKTDNYFDGAALTNRAEMATIVTRLIMPSQRISHDARENAAMADFESSLENDCVAVKVGGYYYCAYKYYPMHNDGSAAAQVYALYKTDGNDNCTELYQAPNGARVSDVSAYLDKVYFCVSYAGSNKGSLMCYDPATRQLTEMYGGCSVRAYCWYDGQLYALAFTNYGDAIEHDEYTFGTIANGIFAKLTGPYSYFEIMDFQPYGYMGKLYFNLSSYAGPTNLYSYDLSSGTVTQMTDTNINCSYFDGHVMYYQVFNADDTYDMNLYALSLAMPDCVDTLGTFPADSGRNNRTLYGRDRYTYCLAGKTGKLVRMDAAGKSLAVINALGEYNAVTFVDDKIIMVPNSFITSNPNEMKVFNLSSYSARTLYGDWIGCSCWYKGARFVADKGLSVYSSTASVSTVKELEIQVTETYFAGSDLIVRAKYINNTDTKIAALRMQYVYVYVGGQLVAASANDFVSMPLVKNAIQTFTFVIAKPDQAANCDLGRGQIYVEITPTFESAVVAHNITATAPTNGSYNISVNGTQVKTSASLFSAEAFENDTVSLTPVPNTEYEVDAVTVTGDNTGTTVAVTKDASGNYNFTMPNEPVTVTMTFKALPTETATDPAAQQ